MKKAMLALAAVATMIGFGACSRSDQTATQQTDNDTNLSVRDMQSPDTNSPDSNLNVEGKDRQDAVSRTGAQERNQRAAGTDQRDRKQRTAGTTDPDTPLEEAWETIKDPDRDGNQGGGEVRSDDIRNSTE